MAHSSVEDEHIDVSISSTLCKTFLRVESLLEYSAILTKGSFEAQPVSWINCRRSLILSTTRKIHACTINLTVKRIFFTLRVTEEASLVGSPNPLRTGRSTYLMSDHLLSRASLH